MEEVQSRRSHIVIPGARKLHDYVNLYFDARNPMLYKLKCNSDEEFCILQINVEVLEFPQVVITDRNAASDFARFYTPEKGMAKLSKDLIFAEYWTDEDPIEQWKKKSIKCAEILVPDRVDSAYVLGSCVANNQLKLKFDCINSGLPCIITEQMFFA